MTYPKIETLFDRKDDFTVDTDKLRRPEFGIIDEWVVTEKIDGSNVRLLWHREGGEFGCHIRGRSDNASFHPDLLSRLEKIVVGCQDAVHEIMEEHDLLEYGLYGEGYGSKIQSGGRYRDDQGFILFDVQAGRSWLDLDQVRETASRLELDMVPVLSGPVPWSLSTAANFAQEGFTSRIAADSTLPAEGIVARTAMPLYNRQGQRVMWKLKTKDFIAGKR